MTAAMASASLRAGMITETIWDGPVGRSASSDSGTLMDLLIDSIERGNEPAPAETLLRVCTRGMTQPGGTLRIVQNTENAVGKPPRTRRDENSSVVIEHRAVCGNIGRDDGTTRGEIIEDLQREVASVRSRGDKDIRHAEVRGDLVPWLPIDDANDAGFYQRGRLVANRRTLAILCTYQDERCPRHSCSDQWNGSNELRQSLVTFERAAI